MEHRSYPGRHWGSYQEGGRAPWQGLERGTQHRPLHYRGTLGVAQSHLGQRGSQGVVQSHLGQRGSQGVAQSHLGQRGSQEVVHRQRRGEGRRHRTR